MELLTMERTLENMVLSHTHFPMFSYSLKPVGMGYNEA